MSTSFRVSFTNKNGTPGSSTFGSKALAEAYARTVKNATVEPVGVAAPEVAVKACPEGTAEAQRAASRDYYLTTKRGERYMPVTVRDRDAERAEREAEAMMEHFNEARIAGMSLADAWADWETR